jgi:hypothetical protein
MITNDTLKSKLSLPPLLKMREVAKVLSLSRASVYALIECGDLAASQLTPTRRKKQRVHLRITRDSLEKFYKKRFGHDLERALQTPFQN